MVSLSINVEASQTSDTLNISLDISQEEWDSMSEERQKELIQAEVDRDHNQPYWIAV